MCRWPAWQPCERGGSAWPMLEPTRFQLRSIFRSQISSEDPFCDFFNRFVFLRKGPRGERGPRGPTGKAGPKVHRAFHSHFLAYFYFVQVHYLPFCLIRATQGTTAHQDLRERGYVPLCCQRGTFWFRNIRIFFCRRELIIDQESCVCFRVCQALRDQLVSPDQRALL